MKEKIKQVNLASRSNTNPVFLCHYLTTEAIPSTFA